MLLLAQNGMVLRTLLVIGTSAHVIYRNRKLKHKTTEIQDQILKSQLCHNQNNQITQGYDQLTFRRGYDFLKQNLSPYYRRKLLGGQNYIFLNNFCLHIIEKKLWGGIFYKFVAGGNHCFTILIIHVYQSEYLTQI